MGTVLKIVKMTNGDARFYPAIGPYLSRRNVAAENGSPIWDDDGKEWFLAYHGRKLVGFAALRVVGSHSSLCSAYVLPEFRKQGVYTALVRARLDGRDGPFKAVATPCSVLALKHAGFKANSSKGKFTVMVRT